MCWDESHLKFLCFLGYHDILANGVTEEKSRVTPRPCFYATPPCCSGETLPKALQTWVAPRNSTAANTAPCPVWTRLFSSQSTLRANTSERFSLGLWNQGCLWAALPHISTPRPGPWALLSAAMAVLLLHHSNQSNWQRRQAKPPETCWQIPIRLQICLNLQTNCFCYWIMLLKAAVWKCNGLENGGQ